MIQVQIQLATKFVQKDENKLKRGRGWPIFKKQQLRGFKNEKTHRLRFYRPSRRDLE